MVVLRRIAWAGLGLVALAGCQRDFSTPLDPPGPDTTGNVGTKPDTSKTKPDTAKPRIVLIESFSAPDLRMKAGETKPAQVTVLPANATSPLYEMTSNKPEVAAVTADGIRGASAGSATITVHALDGSGKTTKFNVIVDAVFNICLLPCVCIGNAMEKEKEKGKEKEKDDCED